MAFDLGSLLNQYLGGGAGGGNPHQANDDFDRVASNAPPDVLARGVTGALRSDQTPPFPQMVSQMFGQSNPNQRAGMLNQLLATLGPAVLSQLASRAGGYLTGKVLEVDGGLDRPNLDLGLPDLLPSRG